MTSEDQVDLIHTAVETAAGRKINTSALDWRADTGELIVNLWLDAEDALTAEDIARAIVKVARNGDST